MKIKDSQTKGEINYIKKFEKGELIDICSIYISIIIIFIICWIIYSLPEIFNKSKIPEDFPIWDFLSPEPAERLMYIISIIFYPIIYFLSRVIIKEKIKYYSNYLIETINKNLILFSSFLIILIFVLDFSVKLRHEYNNVFFNYIKYTLIDTNVFAAISLTVALSLFIFILKNWQKLNTFKHYFYNKIYYIFDVLILFLIFVLSFEHIDKIYDLYHFDAIYYSITQVFNGKNILVDMAAQYGLYAHFIKPLLSIMGGLSVWSFKIIMAIMIFFSFCSIYFFIRQIIQDKIIFFITILALIFYSYVNFYLIYRAREYYQFFPLRSFFPMLFLLLAFIFFKTKNIFLYYIIPILLSFAILWNPDTGVVCFIAWGMVLLYSEFLEKADVLNKWQIIIKRFIFHLINLVSVFIAVLILFSLIIYSNSGKFPDYLKLFLYQKIYYITGFGLIPMTLIHPWNLIILIYILGISKSITAIITKNDKENYQNSVIFLLSILGIGLFTYYQGRSHDWALVPLLYVPVILVGIFSENLINEISHNFFKNKFDFGKIILFLLTIFVLLAPINNAFNKLFNFNYTKFISKFDSKNKKEFFPELKNYIFPGEKVYVLSGAYQSIIYGETKTLNPLNVPGQIELTLNSDMIKVRNYLAEESPGRKIVWDKTDGGEYVNHYNLKFNDKYKLFAALPNYHIFVLKQLEKNEIKKLLLNSKNSILHIKEFNKYVYSLYDKKDNFINNFVYDSNKKIIFKDKLMIEAILFPENDEQPDIEIFTNKKRDSGFVLCSDKYNKNYYKFIWNEQKWECNSPSFYLEPQKLNYLVILFYNENVFLYINGIKIFNIKSKITYNDETIKLADNWSRFMGGVNELLISTNIKTDEEIKATYNRLLQ